MTIFQSLFFLLNFVFISYILFITMKYGVLASISDSYYRLPTKYNYLFTLFCWGFAIPTMIIGLELTGSFLMFLACAGICFVGAAAAFKEDLTKSVHYSGALVGILCSQLSIALDFNMYYVNIIFLTIGILLLLFRSVINNNHIWWIEILAFSSMIYVLGFNLF